MSDSEFIGKFVCYDQADGGACWGHIVEEVVINTMEGEKEAFILDNRYVRYWRTRDLKRFRKFYPDPDDLSLSSPSSISGRDELFQEVRKIKGQSLLRKDMIDLEKDIIDFSDVLEVVGDETLFKAILSVKEEVNGKTALEIGVNALMQDKSLSEEVKAVLKKRLGMEI